MTEKTFKPLPLGNEDFVSLRNKGHYYVDKTPYLKKVFTDPSSVLLFTRPRRFGKTLLMDMFATYLTIGKDGSDNREFKEKLFEGLEILKDKEFTDKYLGQFPVIFISLKSAYGETFEQAYDALARIVVRLFSDYDFLLNSKNLSKDEIENYRKYLNREFLCDINSIGYVKEALEPTKACYSTEEEAKTEDLFDKLKRMPKKEENSWSFVSLEKPELLCDLQADYSQDGVENQRVVAFRYGRFKYTKTEEGAGGFNIDTTNMMPELVGISRIGKDGTKTYFVLMPPIDRIVYRSIKDKTVDPGDKLIEFSVTQDVPVKTPSGRTRIEKQTVPTNVVDGKTGKRLNIFRNKDIPEELEEFFAKVYFSDEYLSSVIKHNARYLGSVEQTKDGPVIHPTDEHKFDLAAAHYAEHFPGIVDRRMVKDFGAFCSSSELEIKQYNLINERETVLRETVQAKGAKRNEGQGLDD